MGMMKDLIANIRKANRMWDNVNTIIEKEAEESGLSVTELKTSVICKLVHEWEQEEALRISEENRNKPHVFKRKKK